jgi:hypothetical protein
LPVSFPAQVRNGSISHPHPGLLIPSRRKVGFGCHGRNGFRRWGKDSTLKGICTDLDVAEIDVPESWRTGATPSLNEVKVKSWTDALDLGYKKLVIDQIRYSLAVVLKVRSSGKT